MALLVRGLESWPKLLCLRCWLLRASPGLVFSDEVMAPFEDSYVEPWMSSSTVAAVPKDLTNCRRSLLVPILEELWSAAPAYCCFDLGVFSK